MSSSCQDYQLETAFKSRGGLHPVNNIEPRIERKGRKAEHLNQSYSVARSAIIDRRSFTAMPLDRSESFRHGTKEFAKLLYFKNLFRGKNTYKLLLVAVCFATYSFPLK